MTVKLIELVDAAFTFEVRARETCALVLPSVHQIILDILMLHRALPLVRCLVEEVSGVWRYTFEAKDGRAWHQVLRLKQGSYAMTFDVAGEWDITEFVPHRTLRDNIVGLLRAHPHITKIEMVMR